jgi:hypothetical protein
MARPEVTGRRFRRADEIEPAELDDLDAYSIGEFCRRHSISVPMFYKMRLQGLMPITFHVGTRRLISIEAARLWRAERERLTAKQASAR